MCNVLSFLKHYLATLVCPDGVQRKKARWRNRAAPLDIDIIGQIIIILLLSLFLNKFLIYFYSLTFQKLSQRDPN